MKFEIIERGYRMKSYQLRLIPESGIFQDFDIFNYNSFGAVPYVIVDGERLFLLPAQRKALYELINRSK
jgi:hypothetical protein